MKRDHSRSSPSFAGGSVVIPVRSSGLRLVIIESPFAGAVEANVAYAKRAVHDCLMRGEAPIASHLLFTQPGILDDDVPGERALGIEAGLAWYRAAEACVVYGDRGLSRGMVAGIERAQALGIPVEHRTLDSVVRPDDPPLCGL